MLPNLKKCYPSCPVPQASRIWCGDDEMVSSSSTWQDRNSLASFHARFGSGSVVDLLKGHGGDTPDRTIRIIKRLE
jgi:hypothetical protein